MTKICSCGSSEIDDLRKVEEYLHSSLAEMPRSRDQLIPLLQGVQQRFGYLPELAITRIARHLKISPNEVYGVATFYAQFRLTPQGRHTVKVCQGTACHVRGAQKLLDTVKEELGAEPGATTPDGEYSVERIACFGACSLAPVVVIDDEVCGNVTQDRLRKMLRQRGKPEGKSSPGENEAGQV